MSKKIVLTGIKPTGAPHLGNLLGAIRPAIELSKIADYEAYYFIADYHALTSVQNAKDFKQYVYEVTATWLALGLNPDKALFYRQSDIKEIFELSWILSCFTQKGLMNRAHAYKARVADNIENKREDEDHAIDMGLYTYPILMAADILMFGTDLVPVGADQVQHVEIARDIAQRFNYRFGNVLKLPQHAIQKEVEVIEGLDGRKMSKSYDNTIPIFAPEKKLQKLINKITTDSTPPEAPKDTSTSQIFRMYKLFASADQVNELAQWYAKGISWGEAKAELFKVLNHYLAEPREKYEKLMSNTTYLDEVLAHGASKAKPRAQETLKAIHQAIGKI